MVRMVKSLQVSSSECGVLVITISVAQEGSRVPGYLSQSAIFKDHTYTFSKLIPIPSL